MFGSPSVPQTSFLSRSGKLGLTALDCILFCRRAFIKTRASAAAIGVPTAVTTFLKPFIADGPTYGPFEKSKQSFGRGQPSRCRLPPGRFPITVRLRL